MSVDFRPRPTEDGAIRGPEEGHAGKFADVCKKKQRNKKSSYLKRAQKKGPALLLSSKTDAGFGSFK